MMKRLTIRDPDTGTIVQASLFHPGQGVREVYLCGFAPGRAPAEQLAARLLESYRSALGELGLPEESVVFRRLHASRGNNGQAGLAGSPLAESGDGPDSAAVAFVGQPVSPDGGLGLWAYHLHEDTPLKKTQVKDGVVIRRPGSNLLWLAGLPGEVNSTNDPAAQTRLAFEACAAELDRWGGNMADHLLRTWVYVDDIDRNYQSMCDTRRELFGQHGLTSRTHYIVSTGIGADFSDDARVISLDSCAAIGLSNGQVHYLAAPHLLSRTDLYGVTFERGATVSFGERKHILLAGTASCSSEGETLHSGDVPAQLERVIKNLEGLLAEAGGTLSDLAYLLAYVRNNEDGASVRSMLSESLPDVPLLVVQGPVCRPEWLVEVEGAALLADSDSRWLPF